MRATLATRHVTHARVTGNAPGHGHARQLRESLDLHPQSDVSTAQSVAHVANATYAVAIPAGAKCCCQPEAPPQPIGGDVAGVAESSGQSLLQRNISGNRDFPLCSLPAALAKLSGRSTTPPGDSPAGESLVDRDNHTRAISSAPHAPAYLPPYISCVRTFYTHRCWCCA